MNLEQLFNQNKEKTIQGRYITLENIEPLLNSESLKKDVKIIGQSVLGKPIYSYQKGNGKLKIYLGHKCTVTKVLPPKHYLIL